MVHKGAKVFCVRVRECELRYHFVAGLKSGFCSYIMPEALGSLCACVLMINIVS